MTLDAVFPFTVAAAALLCALVAGFLFAFAVVAMPGIARLDDRGFLRAFGAMDRVIQDNQPVFMAVWVGSVVTLLGALALSSAQADRGATWMLSAAAALYLLGVQAPTAAVNVPLNNRLQALDLDAMNDAELGAARAAFEPRWNRFNALRAVFACLTAATLLGLLLRL